MSRLQIIMGICKSKANQTGNDVKNMTKSEARKLNQNAKADLKTKTKNIADKVTDKVVDKEKLVGNEIKDGLNVEKQVDKVTQDVKDAGKDKAIQLATNNSTAQQMLKEELINPTNFSDMTDVKETSFRHSNNWLAKMNNDVMKTMETRLK